MKKKLNKLLIVISAIFGVYYLILYPTGWLVVYSKVPATANEPGIPINSRMISSNLVEPEVLDFITFNYSSPIVDGNQRVFRLIGVEGDTIQIKDGVLYKNGENIDSNLDLMKRYVLNKRQFYTLKTTRELAPDTFYKMRDTFLVELKDSDTIVKHMRLEKVERDSLTIDETIQGIYKENWNSDFFGPLVIPKNKYFVLGDNRDNSYDSRFIGLIDKEDLIGTVIAVF